MLRSSDGGSPSICAAHPEAQVRCMFRACFPVSVHSDGAFKVTRRPTAVNFCLNASHEDTDRAREPQQQLSGLVMLCRYATRSQSRDSASTCPQPVTPHYNRCKSLLEGADLRTTVPWLWLPPYSHDGSQAKAETLFINALHNNTLFLGITKTGQW